MLCAVLVARRAVSPTRHSCDGETDRASPDGRPRCHVRCRASSQRDARVCVNKRRVKENFSRHENDLDYRVRHTLIHMHSSHCPVRSEGWLSELAERRRTPVGLRLYGPLYLT